MSVTKLNAQSFDQEVLHSNKPVLVDFYADWCGPCKMLSPVVEEIAGESDAYRVCKINVDDAPEIAARSPRDEPSHADCFSGRRSGCPYRGCAEQADDLEHAEIV